MILIDKKVYFSYAETADRLRMSEQAVYVAMSRTKRGVATLATQRFAKLQESLVIQGTRTYFPEAVVLALVDEIAADFEKRLALHHELIDLLNEANATGARWGALAKQIGVSPTTLSRIKALEMAPSEEKLNAYIAAMRGEQ